RAYRSDGCKGTMVRPGADVRCTALPARRIPRHVRSWRPSAGDGGGLTPQTANWCAARDRRVSMDFAEWVMEYRGHSTLMLAARITLAHFSVSSAMSLPKSAGEPESTEAPRSARRALIVGSARARLISLFNFSTM